MDINSLHQKFKKNSRLQEENTEKIDSKHVEIIKNSKENFKNLEWSNFRNWKDQNDMGLRYPMTYLSKVFLGIKKNKIIDFILKIPRKRLNHYFHYSSMLDDIEIVKSLGGDYLLNENPQNKTPGAIKFPLVEGYSVSSRWLRYVYILTNPAWKGWIKVGMAVDAGDRCKQYQTSSPFRDYKLRFKKYFDNKRSAEQQAHKKIRNISKDNNGEWFKVSISEAEEIIQSI